jgi:hypothetical protein
MHIDVEPWLNGLRMAVAPAAIYEKNRLDRL